MRPFRTLACLVIVFGAAEGAWAQYGLSGAPEPLRLGPDSRDIGPPSAYPVGVAGATNLGGGYGPPQGYDAGTQGLSNGPQATPQPAPPPTSYSGRMPVPSANYGASPRYLGAYSGAYAARTSQSGTVTPAGADGPLGPTPAATPVPRPEPSPNVMSQMLDESGCCGAPPYAAGRMGCGCGDPCAGSCDACCPQPWYAWGAGLMMTRDKINSLGTTFETDNFPNFLMHLSDADIQWQAGYELRVGRRFGPCEQWAIEAGYWRIDSFSGFASASVPDGSVDTPLLVGNIEFAGINGTAYFNDAIIHSIWRHDILDNAEINVIRGPVLFGGECCPMDLQWLVGFRYFRFEESLVFGTETDSGDTAFLSDRVFNNLFGVQVGWEAGCRLGCKWRAFASTKLGCYDNHIVNIFDAYRGDGVHANPTAASGAVGTFPVSATKDQFSFLAQLDAGVEWRLHPQWRAFGGYRMIAATGIALADDQFLTNVADIQGYQTIKSHGDLVLHGAFAGLEFRF